MEKTINSVGGTSNAVAKKLSIAGSGYSPSPDTTFTQDPCTVAESSNARSGLYAPNPDSDELIELEMASCRVMAGLEEPSRESLHEHAMVHVDRGPTLHGAAAGNEYFGSFNQEGTDFLTYEVIEAHVSDSRDMGWTHGLYKFQPVGGEMEVGKFVSIWHKEESGWKIVSEMRNPY